MLADELNPGGLTARTAHPLDLPLFDPLHEIDWEDMKALEAVGVPILKTLARRPALIAAAMEHVLGDAQLFARCETDEFFDRVVLFDGRDRYFSVRLQSLVQCEEDRPHNHRASLCTMILSGGYEHHLYRSPLSWADDPDMGAMAAAELTRIMVRDEKPGSTYALHHSAFHSASPSGLHFSLVLRGPSRRKRLLFFDRIGGEGAFHFHLGSKDQPLEKEEARHMSRATMLDVMAHFAALPPLAV